jgi:hypothetical protein
LVLVVKIKCHSEDYYAQRFAPQEWREGSASRPWLSCSYCGCMHPEYLIEALKNGATLGGSDWKYGWPHKFYVTVPNPEPEQLFTLVSCSYDPKDPAYEKINDREWVQRGKRETLTGKWYNIHLLDDGVPEELFEVLFEHSNIKFEVEDMGLKYSAPRQGYQVHGF